MSDSANPAARTAPRFDELDSLRGLAALVVVLWHYSGMFSAQPLAGPLRPLYLGGGLLVDFFFVLSGFVLSLSYDREGRRDRFGRNLWQRVARMYPLHVVTLLVVLACDTVNVMQGQPRPASNDAYHFVLNLLLLQSSGLQHGYSFNGPSWSISAEFLINALFLALLAWGGRAGRWLMAALAVACAGALLHTGILNHSVPVEGRLDGVVDLSLVRCWFGFYLGTLCYRGFARRHGNEAAPASWRGDVVGALALAAVVAYMARALPQSHLGDVLLAALAFPALILGTLHSHLLRAVLRWRPLTWLGEVSYSIYLVHVPLIAWLLVANGRFGPWPMQSPWMLLAFYALVLAVAALTHRWVELPGKRWLGSWTLRLPTGAHVARRLQVARRRRGRRRGIRAAMYRRFVR
ncbi:acyltransferase family protein [Frateuria defendens]|uniref:acyltransferase family protein n=1 Tax=Frateuria defendens TaxID=2219559 RepID=UPI00066FB561|nr:acyltransferase [Frateuria defendens]